MHQQKTARAVGVLHVPGLEAALAEERALLVSRRARNGYLPAEERRLRLAVDAARGLHLGQHPLRYAEELQQLGVPAQPPDVEEHRARGVGHVRHVCAAAREVPDEPAVYRPEEQTALLRAPARAGDLVQYPAQLGAGEIGVRHKAGPLPYLLSPTGGCQRICHGRRAPALPDYRGADGRAGLLVPDHRRLTLVRDAYGRNVRGGQARLCHGPPGHLQGRLPNLRGVVLHPAGLGVVLGKLLLCRGEHCA